MIVIGTLLLFQYSVTLAVIFFCELVLAIIAFIFPERVLDELKSKMSEEVIVKYRDDDDLKNLIDFLQREVATLFVFTYKELLKIFLNKQFFIVTEISSSAVEYQMEVTKTGIKTSTLIVQSLTRPLKVVEFHSLVVEIPRISV